MPDIMMACGCRANAEFQGKPSCVIHLTSQVAEIQPDLTGRVAQCGCGKESPSSLSLPFFEFQGPDSHDALTMCKCGYHYLAHSKEFKAKDVDPRTVIELGKCKGFEPRGPREKDRFYCGCRGWD